MRIVWGRRRIRSFWGQGSVSFSFRAVSYANAVILFVKGVPGRCAVDFVPYADVRAFNTGRFRYVQVLVLCDPPVSRGRRQLLRVARGPVRLNGSVGLANVLEVLGAWFQARYHPFSSLETELATAVHSSLASPGLLPAHLGAVRCHLSAVLNRDHHSSYRAAGMCDCFNTSLPHLLALCRDVQPGPSGLSLSQSSQRH